MTTDAPREHEGTPLTRDADRDPGAAAPGAPLNAAESDPSLEELSRQEGEVKSAPAGAGDEPTDGREPLNPA